MDLRAHDKDRDRVAEEIVRGTAERLAEIDPLIAEAAANWRLERMAVIDRLILRLATYELLAMPGTPPRWSSTKRSSWRGRSAPKTR